MQQETRRERHFQETESELEGPMLPRKAIPASSVQGLFSRLGPLNPISSPIRSDDVVWLFDNTAYRPQPGASATAITRWMPNLPGPLGKLTNAIGSAVAPRLETGLGSLGYAPARNAPWAAEFSAAVFEQEPRCSVVDVVSEIARKVGLADDSQDMETIERRLTPFLQDVRPGRKMTVIHGGKELRLGPTGSGGISMNGHPVVADLDQDGLVHGEAVVPKGVKGVFKMKTYYSGPEGWGVISDIDDTIKITQTSDPIGILRSTFIDPATPIAGTPELYRTLHALLQSSHPDPHEHVPFFYLSASPYNLYPFLRAFRDDEGFPPGQLMLRDSSWRTIAGLLSALTVRTQEYKVGQMRRVRTWFPKRKMIFIGDSTQSDPESYGEIYREFPGWVKLILIRKATDIAAVGIESKNEDARFEKAFEGVPRDAWFVFEDPSECMAKIEAAVQRG